MKMKARERKQMKAMLETLAEEYAGDNKKGPLTMDGFDACIIGCLERFGQPRIVVYDKRKVLDTMIADGMTEEEATEFYEFNQLGAYVGESTPAFLTLLDDFPA